MYYRIYLKTCIFNVDQDPLNEADMKRKSTNLEFIFLAGLDFNNLRGVV